MTDIILILPRAGSLDLLGARLPIGLLSIAAIPFTKGYKLKIIDQRIDNSWQQTLIQHLKKNPVCVGITSMTGKQISYAIEASKLVKEYSDVPVVWGGVHATMLPEQTLSNPYVDIIVMREGDITFMDLIEALEKNKPLSNIQGIYYKDNNKIIKTLDRDFIKNLDELPELPYELLNVSNYSSINITGRSLDFVSSRGCPFKCSFCYNNHHNKCIWRAMSAEETVKRVTQIIEKYKVKTIYFQDDNFCTDVNRLRDILKGIIREKLDIQWGTLGLRADTLKSMDDNLLDLMEKSGCVNVDIGAESGNKRILELIDKQIRTEDILNANKRLSKYPFIVKYSFITGIPTETEQEMWSTTKLAIKLTRDNKNAYTPFFIYAPYPKTPLYDLALRNGLIPPKNLEEWARFGGDDWYLHFKSWMTPKQARRLNSVAFTSLFANENVRYKINKLSTKILFELYHPIAKFRFTHNFHSLPVDSMVASNLRLGG